MMIPTMKKVTIVQLLEDRNYLMRELELTTTRAEDGVMMMMATLMFTVIPACSKVLIDE